MNKYKIFPISENALTINFGNEISPEINDLVLDLAEHFEQNSFVGYTENIPAYSSLTIFYNLLKVRKSFSEFKTAFDAVKSLVENALQKLKGSTKIDSRLVEIPVNFGKDFALDLEFVASKNELSTEKVIEIFTSQDYRVYMLGFLPGFAYMGEINEKIVTPRKQTPRKHVPKGSVGIAGKQTGIYPLDSPGGWQIIGKTDIELFTPESESPTFFQTGDLVKFYAI